MPWTNLINIYLWFWCHLRQSRLHCDVTGRCLAHFLFLNPARLWQDRVTENFESGSWLSTVLLTAAAWSRDESQKCVYFSKAEKHKARVYNTNTDGPRLYVYMHVYIYLDIQSFPNIAIGSAWRSVNFSNHTALVYTQNRTSRQMKTLCYPFVRNRSVTKNKGHKR